MTNQPNKATVKDGLPTAEEVIDKYPMEKDFWSFVISRESAIQAMQEYSDQQNAELMSEIERWKEVSELGKKSISELIKANEKLESVESENTELRGRVKELEGLLTIWVKQNSYLRRHSISDFDEVHDQTKKSLKK